MALFNCPECGQRVSDKALKCPRCGYPIVDAIRKKSEEKTAIQTEPTAIGETVVAKENTEHIAEHKEAVLLRKTFVIAVVLILVITLVVGFALSSTSVKNIEITKWRLTDSSDSTYYYNGKVVSKQKKPFVAIIEYGENSKKLVYMEDGEGVIETSEDSDTDPSLKYQPIGYINGTKVKESDLKVTYSDRSYEDDDSLETTTCLISFDIEMNDLQSGLLVFDIENKTDNENETEHNMVAEIIDGKTTFYYYASLPYKARGEVEISVIPKLFCKATDVKSDDYEVKDEYSLTWEYDDEYYTYIGEETLAFDDYEYGYVIYTKELKKGENEYYLNKTQYCTTLLDNGECTLTTYDRTKFKFNEGRGNLTKPEYEFNVVSIVSWKKI